MAGNTTMITMSMKIMTIRENTPMAQAKTAQHRKTDTRGIKALIAAFALAATLGGWAGLAGQEQPAETDTTFRVETTSPASGAAENVPTLREVTAPERSVRPAPVTVTRSSR